MKRHFIQLLLGYFLIEQIVGLMQLERLFDYFELKSSHLALIDLTLVVVVALSRPVWQSRPAPNQDK